MRDIGQRYCVSAGSVLGREHARTGRNNQDGVAVRVGEEGLVAVVTDGCSAGRYSEVGARLGAAYLAEHGMRCLRRGDHADEDLPSELCAGLLDYLRALVDPLGSDAARSATVQDFLLFGFLCLIIDGERALLFGIGDGVYSLDGVTTVLDPGPDNAPRYLAYGLLDRSALAGPRPSTSASVHLRASSQALRSIVLGTDGLVDLLAPAPPLRDGQPQGDLGQFERELPISRNPSLVQKRLVVIGELNRRLRDDTTLVVVRRTEAAS